MTINRININTLKKCIDDDQTVLVPNLRTKDAILFQYLEEQKETIAPAPKIFPIDIFITDLWKLNARSGTSNCSIFRIISPD